MIRNCPADRGYFARAWRDRRVAGWCGGHGGGAYVRWEGLRITEDDTKSGTANGVWGMSQ